MAPPIPVRRGQCEQDSEESAASLSLQAWLGNPADVAVRYCRLAVRAAFYWRKDSIENSPLATRLERPSA